MDIANSGQEIGIISAAAFSFIVQEPERDHRPVQRQVAVATAGACSASSRSRPGSCGTPDGSDRRCLAQRCPAAGCRPSRSQRFSAARRPARPARAPAPGVVSSSVMPDPGRADLAEVDPLAPPGRQDPALHAADLDRDRVEELRRRHLVAAALPAPRASLAVFWMHPLRDRLQALRPVEHRVERRHHRQQRLRGADVRRRLLAPDMLLAGLQATADRPCCPARRSRPRRSAPASTACSRPGRPYRPPPARHSPSARRTAGSSRPRCRPPSRRAPSAASAPADRRSRSPTAPAPCSAAISPVEIPHLAIGAGILEDRPKHRAGIQSRPASPTITSIPSGSARVRITAMFCGWQPSSMKNAFAFDFATRSAIAIASAAAVASSSSEALAMSSPVRSQTIVWIVQQRLQPALARSPADRAYRPCTRPGSPGCCAGSPAA